MLQANGTSNNVRISSSDDVDHCASQVRLSALMYTVGVCIIRRGMMVTIVLTSNQLNFTIIFLFFQKWRIFSYCHTCDRQFYWTYFKRYCWKQKYIFSVFKGLLYTWWYIMIIYSKQFYENENIELVGAHQRKKKNKIYYCEKSYCWK